MTLPQCKNWLHEQADKKKKQQKLLLRPLESNTCDVMSFDIFSEKSILWNLLEILKPCSAFWNITILENYDIYNINLDNIQDFLCDLGMKPHSYKPHSYVYI